jgi:O-antigen/teichoic acid export membrane protein
MEEKNKLFRQAVGSVKWTLLGSLLPRTISPIIALALAAILAPADFGIVAVSMLIIALAQIIVGLGLGPALIQRRTMVIEAASTAFWMSLSVACVLYGVLWFSAPWVARIYHIPLVADVVRVSGITLILFAMGTVPSALLQRNLEFRKIFWVESLSQVVGVGISLVLALNGAGVWALVFGPLIGAAIRTVLAWGFSGWHPSFSVSRALLRPLTDFGLWMMGSGFLSWLFLYADNAIAGYFFGGVGLGIYSLGFNISNLLAGLVVPALSLVAYPTFCALQADHRDVGRALLQIHSLTAAVLFPLSFGISAVAVPAIALLYGARWQGLGELVSILAILPGASHLWSFNADAYRSIGRPDLWAKLSVLNVLILIPLLWLAGPYGFVSFTLARFAGAFIYPLLNMVMGGAALGISTRDQLRVLSKPFGCTAAMYVIATLMVKTQAPFEGIHGWLKLLGVIAVSASIYLVLLRIIGRELWNRLLLGARQVLEKG